MADEPDQVAIDKKEYMKAVLQSANVISVQLGAAKAAAESQPLPGNFFIQVLALAIADVLTKDESKELARILPGAHTVVQKTKQKMNQ